jgi:hypothetical protein
MKMFRESKPDKLLREYFRIKKEKAYRDFPTDLPLPEKERKIITRNFSETRANLLTALASVCFLALFLLTAPHPSGLALAIEEKYTNVDIRQIVIDKLIYVKNLYHNE